MIILKKVDLIPTATETINQDQDWKCQNWGSVGKGGFGESSPSEDEGGFGEGVIGEENGDEEKEEENNDVTECGREPVRWHRNDCTWLIKF